MNVQIDFATVLAKNTVIETERLILRPMTLADTADMFDYACDKETTYFVFPTHHSLAETERSIATFF